MTSTALAAAIAGVLLALPATAEEWTDKPLLEALRLLEGRGLRLIYSTHVVWPEMRVESEPRSSEPRQILDEILTPHGLAARPAPAGRWVVVPRDDIDESPRGEATGGPSGNLEILIRGAPWGAEGEAGGERDGEPPAGEPLAGVRVRVLETELAGTTGSDGRLRLAGIPAGTYTLEARLRGYEVGRRTDVEITAGGTREITLDLVAEPLVLDGASEEIVVSASYRLYQREPVHPVALSRQDIRQMPHFGDDLYRAIGVLPGIAASDFSSRLNLRGGLYSEVLVELDGLELIEPFHLKDAQGLFSILDPEVIADVDVIPGSFSVEYGDRMTGVLDLTSAAPDASRSLRLGISITHAWLGGAGSFAQGRGRFLASLRRGYLDILFSGEDDETLDPQYWDGFGKLDVDLGPASSLAFEVLAAQDWFELDEVDPPGHLGSEYGDTYLGLSHRAITGPRSYVETLLSASRLDRDRDIFSRGQERREVRDRRRVDVLGAKHDWSWQPNRRHAIHGGFELRRDDAHYDYWNELTITEAIAAVRFRPPIGRTVYLGDVTGERYAAFLADRMELGRLTVELGGRWDHQTLTGDDQMSPRVNLVLDLGRGGALRAGWGHFSQSHRPHELDVQDGETELFPAERAEHWTAGWERQLSRGLTLRLDAYLREVEGLRPRFENLFDPVTVVPEGESDRIRIAAEQATAAGLELFLSWRRGGKLDGWLSYALSSAADRVDGCDQPRAIDQRHALTLSGNFRPGPRWNLNLVWRYHSGWPTTAVTGDLGDDGELRFAVGPFYEEHLPAYQRLDLRATRTRPFKGGELTFFIDVQNVSGRANIRGVEYQDDRYDVVNGDVVPRPVIHEWPRIIPSFGFSVSF